MSNGRWDRTATEIQGLMLQEGLPANFLDTVERYFLPLAESLAETQRQAGKTLVVGINGAQGTGKSTLALFLSHLLTHCFECPSARFSIDDIYLTLDQRVQLSESVHPLLKTRGVPGTHDIELGHQTLEALAQATTDSLTPIPAFNKATDDRVPRSQWPLHPGPAAVILVEGWCVGAKPEQDQQHLRIPFNDLEREADADGRWRQYVNHQLEGSYAGFFGLLDQLIMLKAPSMDCIIEWRTLQEQKLVEKVFAHYYGAAGEAAAHWVAQTLPQSEAATGIMSPQQVKWFIMHYERLTCAMLAEMPQRANAVYAIDTHHQITGVKHHGG